MERTLEVRWFVDGPVPFSVNDWADALGLTPESARTDLYLVSKDGGMNVKLRDEKVQTKRRLEGPSPISLTEDVRGYQEHWVKWSFPMLDDAPDLFRDDPTGLWVPVHKERRQRLLDPSDYGELLGTSLDTPARSKIELTEVNASGHEAHTICVEAEGREEALQETLEAVGAALFGHDDAPSLQPNASLGYAKWLSTLVSQGNVSSAPASASA